MAPLTHGIYVAWFAVWSTMVGVDTNTSLKISPTTVAVKMFRVPGLVKCSDTVLHCNQGVITCINIATFWSNLEFNVEYMQVGPQIDMMM